MRKSNNLNRNLLSDQIAAELRKMILSGKLVPGQSITEYELVEIFDVSRTPLREALQKIRSEGLIDISNSRRMKIAQPDRKDTRDRLIVLKYLEQCAGEIAAQKTTQKEVEVLEKLQQKMLKFIQQDNCIAYFETNIKFHRYIVEMTQNNYLIDTHREYDNCLYRHRFLSSSYSKVRRNIAVDDHEKIIQALKHNDVELSKKLLHEHLNNTLLNVEKYWQDNPR